MLLIGSPVSGPETFQIWRVDFPQGTSRPITTGATQYQCCSISLTSDGKMAATTAADVRANLWIVPVRNGGQPRAIASGIVSYDPVWSVNGQIAYVHEEGDSYGASASRASGGNQRLLINGGSSPAPCGGDGSFVAVIARDGQDRVVRIGPTGQTQILVETESSSPICTPDGKWVVYVSHGSPGRTTLWRVPAEGGTPARITTEGVWEPQISPDGKRLACYYGSVFTPTTAMLAVLDLETASVIKTFDIQRDFGYHPVRWTRDGSALTYVDEHSKLWRLPVDGSPSSVLMDFAPDRVFGFDWSPDGKELVVARGQWNQDVVLIRDTSGGKHR
jgi:Tol biopolymer transport system component